MIYKAATIAVQAAALAVFIARPSVPQAAAIGMAALAFLLAVDARQSRTPFLRGRTGMLAAAALLTAAALLAAPFHIGWLGFAAPIAIVAVYIAALLSPTFSLPRQRNRGTARDPR